ncbi:MAG: FHA domain-containing protein [Anaerolineales bacterium]
MSHHQQPDASDRGQTRKFSEAEAAALRQSLHDSQKRPPEPLRQGLLRLDLVEVEYSITIPIKEKITLGRPDPLTGLEPDIDFTPLAGYRMGVSRRHAEIHWYRDNLIYLYDMGSSNRTYLNGEEINFNQGYPLYNGDMFSLGRLAIYVYYEIQAEQPIIPVRRT